jgi:hypothetical protein
MRSQHDYLIKISCTGIIILILLSIPIFYLGQIYYTPLSKHLWPREMENPFISPSGLANQWDDANSIIPSRAYVHLGRINRNRMTDLFLHGSSFFPQKVIPEIATRNKELILIKTLASWSLLI